ncbi:MAG: hypothetical protein EZS28_014551, partial [Streblomastix strix]
MEEIELGVLVNPEPDEQITFRSNHVGGQPRWINTSGNDFPKLICTTCGQELSFFLQIYAPFEHLSHAHERVLYVFMCTKGSCINRGSVRLFRTQTDQAIIIDKQQDEFEDAPEEIGDDKTNITEDVESKPISKQDKKRARRKKRKQAKQNRISKWDEYIIDTFPEEDNEEGEVRDDLYEEENTLLRKYIEDANQHPELYDADSIRDIPSSSSQSQSQSK